MVTLKPMIYQISNFSTFFTYFFTSYENITFWKITMFPNKIIRIKKKKTQNKSLGQHINIDFPFRFIATQA